MTDEPSELTDEEAIEIVENMGDRLKRKLSERHPTTAVLAHEPYTALPDAEVVWGEITEAAASMDVTEPPHDPREEEAARTSFFARREDTPKALTHEVGWTTEPIESTEEIPEDLLPDPPQEFLTPEPEVSERVLTPSRVDLLEEAVIVQQQVIVGLRDTNTDLTEELAKAQILLRQRTWQRSILISEMVAHSEGSIFRRRLKRWIRMVSTLEFGQAPPELVVKSRSARRKEKDLERQHEGLTQTREAIDAQLGEIEDQLEYESVSDTVTLDITVEKAITSGENR